MLHLPVSNTGNLEEFLRQLFFTWSEFRRKPAQLLKSGDIGKRDQRRMAEGLGLSEEQDLHRVQLLVCGSESVEPGETK